MLKRLYAEITAAAVSAAISIATLIEPQWFERLFDESPDGGDGSLETIAAVGAFAIAAVVFAARAFIHWKQQSGATQRIGSISS
jgi:hypothetical protein